MIWLDFPGSGYSQNRSEFPGPPMHACFLSLAQRDDSVTVHAHQHSCRPWLGTCETSDGGSWDRHQMPANFWSRAYRFSCVLQTLETCCLKFNVMCTVHLQALKNTECSCTKEKCGNEELNHWNVLLFLFLNKDILNKHKNTLPSPNDSHMCSLNNNTEYFSLNWNSAGQGCLVNQQRSI